MKRNILTAGFLLMTFGLLAQITITTLPVPADGDTIVRYSDFSPGQIDLGAPAPDQIWNFDLSASPPVETLVTENDQDSLFASANRVLSTLVIDMYYSMSESLWSIRGLTGQDPVGLGFNVQSRYSTPLVDMRAPLAFQDAHDQSTQLITDIPLALIPDSLLNLLPLVPDSLRGVVVFLRDEMVDASGMLTIDDNNWEVLRQSRRDITEFRVEAKFSIFPWADVTALIVSLLQVEIPLIDTVMSYRFLAENEGMPVAEVFVDPDGSVQRVDFGVDGVVSGTKDIGTQDLVTEIFPNPSTGKVTLRSENAFGSLGKVSVFQMDGTELPCRWEAMGDHKVQLEILTDHAGNIVVVLYDKQGYRMGTRLVQVVR